MTDADLLRQFQIYVDEMAESGSDHGVEVKFDELNDLMGYIQRLQLALGLCRKAKDGKHRWVMMPVGSDGRRATVLNQASYAAACFCQDCEIPHSPYHEPAP